MPPALNEFPNEGVVVDADANGFVTAGVTELFPNDDGPGVDPA